MSTIIKGNLEAYWEQGFEGHVLYTFIPSDGSPMILIRDGQHLRIFDVHQSLLWEGEIKLVSRKYCFFFYEHPNLA